MQNKQSLSLSEKQSLSPRKILILAGGKTNHLLPFVDAAKKLNINVSIASFSDLSYQAFRSSNFKLEISGKDIKSFDLIYIRLVGRHFEELSVVVDFARKNNIKLVDSVYQNSNFVRLPFPKSLETKILYEAGIPMPSTIFGSLNFIKEKAPRYFGESFIIKDTAGKQGHGVWWPRNSAELEEIISKLLIKEAEDSKRFLAQEFIKSGQRTRVLVIGGKAVAAITRPTKWRKRFIKPVDGVIPAGKREAINPIPEKDATLAVKAAKALGIDIAGVDILHQEETGMSYILEVNSAPRWESIEKDTGIKVEEEILKYLMRVIK